MRYKIKYFKIQELVSQRIYRNLGNKSILLFEDKVLQVLDSIKLFYMRMCSNNNVLIVVNTWHNEFLQDLVGGKSFKYRGFRENDYHGGAKDSQHRYANAFDFDVFVKISKLNYTRVNPILCRKYLIKNHKTDKNISKITRIEDNVNWLHVDFKETGIKKLVVFDG